MFNLNLKERMVTVERRLAIHEGDIADWRNEVCALRMRIQELEKNQLISGGINMQSPFGAKFSFTFTNPDGTANGGFCSDAESLPRLVEVVKELGGSQLVIKDETIYLKVTKSELLGED